MEVLIDLGYYLALFLVPFVIYVLLIDKKHGTDWLYFIKLYFAKAAIRKFQKKRHIETCLKENLELTPQLFEQKDSDVQYIHGIDQKGNSICLKFALKGSNLTEISLNLRLENGNTYILPGIQNIHSYSVSQNWWKVKGLNIEILEPFKRFRLTFNGFLKNITKKDEDNVEYVQFNFIWNASGTPRFFPQDANTALLAAAVATEKWKDGNWRTMLADISGYEQFGSMQGFVKGDAYKDELTFNLVTSRSRFWGIEDRFLLKRELRVYTVGRDGTAINFVAKSYNKGCSQLTFGNVILNNGKILPIIDADIKMENIGNDKSFSDAFTSHIKVDGKVLKCVFHLNVSKMSRLVKRDVKGYEYFNIPCECDINNMQGKAILEFWYTKQGKPIENPQPVICEKKFNVFPNVLVCNICSEDAKILELTGGKGNSLALLSSLKSKYFTVPDGFIVTVNAYKKQLEYNIKLRTSINILESICHGKIQGKLENACNETANLFKVERILPEISEAILHELKSITDKIESAKLQNVTSWAVRSSATGEDSEDLSAAGQNDTFLGCSDYESILKSISSCWASLFTFQSVQYRRQHGLPIKSEMAVVIQKMVPSDSAGVLFTCHPSTANASQIVITSNYGLGESVVSGKSEPDTFILRRTWDDKISFQSETLGTKKNAMKMTETGVEEVENNEESSKTASITKKQALLLGKVGIKLENAFGSARDIEWTFYQDKLFLLQSRPITTLNTWTDFELLHEFDTPILSDQNVYTVANCGEVFPGVVSVLTQSTVMGAIDKAYVERSGQANSCFSSVQHHAIINVIDGIHSNAYEQIPVSSKILDLAIFGHAVINEAINEISKARHGLATSRKVLKRALTEFWDARNNNKIVKQILEESKQFIINLLEEDSLIGKWEKINKAQEVLIKLSLLHCTVSQTSVFYQIVAMNMLLERNNELTVNHYTDIALLLSSCGDVISAEVPVLLVEISNIISNYGNFEEFSKIDPSEGIVWLKTKCPEASKLLEKFLDRHGHRTIGEFKLEEETWRMQPGKVIRMLQMNNKKSDNKIPAKTIDSVDETIAKLVSPQSNVTRIILKFVIKRMRTAVAIREQSKSELIKSVDKIRAAYKELAKEMVLNGLLPSKDLVFHLTHQEIRMVINESSPLLIGKAMKRQRLFNTWDKIKFPEIMYGYPEAETNETVVLDKANVICKGTPVCSGDVKARACVINSLEHIGQLQPGDILITYCTDIGWSPYFPILSGVITELGGLISHGAVVAREYGLPCIVGVKDATKIFKTGDLLFLSGKTGTLHLISNY